MDVRGSTPALATCFHTGFSFLHISMKTLKTPSAAPSPAAMLTPQDAECISSGDEQNDQGSTGVAVAVGNLLSPQAAADLNASFEQATKGKASC
jgi:hypothetical protein